MSSWILAAAVVAAVIGLVLRRLRGEPLVARELYGTPAILIGIGIYGLVKVNGLTVVDAVWLAGGSLLGLALGCVRGHTVRLFVREGELWQRYTGRTFAVWVGALVVNFGFGALATMCGMHQEARPMTLSIGIGLLGEALAVGRTALAMGVPYAPAEDGLLQRR